MTENLFYDLYLKAYRDFQEGNLSKSKSKLSDARLKLPNNESELPDAISKFNYICQNSTGPIVNNCMRWCGIISMELGEYEKAKKYFNDLLIRLEENKDFDIAIERVIDPNYKAYPNTLEALIYHDLGYTYICLKDYYRAEENIIKAINTREISPGTKAWFLNDLGLCYFEWGKFDNAIEQYDEALKLDLWPSYIYGYSHLYRGLALYGKNDLVRAKNSLLDAKCKFESEDKKPHIELVKASVFINIGRIEIINKDFDQAYCTLENASRIYADKSNKNYIKSLTPKNRNKEEQNIRTLKILQGIIQYEEGEYEKAEKKLVGLNSALALNTLGCIYIKMSNTEKGKEKDKDHKEKSADYIERAKNSFEDAKIKAEADQNESLRIIINRNLKILSQKKIKSEPADWWNWWNSSKWKRRLGCVLGILLISSLVMGIFIIPIIYNTGDSIETTTFKVTQTHPLVKNGSEILITTEIPNTADIEVESQESAETSVNKMMVSSIINTTTTDTLYPLDTTTKKTTDKNDIGPETMLLFSVFIFVILIHPLIKSFSAGSVKMDLQDKPTIATRGASASVDPEVKV